MQTRTSNLDSAPERQRVGHTLLGPAPALSRAVAGSRDDYVTRMDKEQQLIAWLREQGAIAIGYSGGVDSAYLAAVAVAALGTAKVLPIIGRSASFPENQWRVARSIADQLDLEVVEVATGELDDPRYAANPTNRCYFCKSELWSRLIPVARQRGISVMADGTNADDLRDHRPGRRAGQEYGVVSPLAMFDLSKEEIRERSRARGLPTWDQPSSPCLSSRIPYGTPVTLGRLQRVERAEEALRALGIRGDLRVRHFGEMARVELSPAELAQWSMPGEQTRLEAVVMGSGYTRVEIDPRGFRSGALNQGSHGNHGSHGQRAALSGD